MQLHEIIRSRALWLTAALLLPAFTFHASAQPAPSFPAGSAMEKLSKAPKLRIGVKFDQPLFGLRDLSGKPVGFDIEIAKLIAARLGFSPDKIEWIETSSANREPFLQQGKVDIIVATYATNEKRRKVVTFAGPYIIAAEDLIVKKGNPLGIKGPDDLTGRKTCVINGSEGHNVLMQTNPKTEIVPFDVISKCLEALKNGSVDAIATANLIEAGLVSRDPESIEIVKNPYHNEPWGIGLPKEQPELCPFVQNVLQEAGANGTYTRIYDEVLKPYLGPGQLPAKLDECP